MIDKGSSGDFTTVIGADAVFKGELEFEKGVRVDGRIEGKIATKGQLAVSQAGKLQADVQAGSVLVEGEVKGNLTSTGRIELRQTARLNGDIKAAKLLVAEGASLLRDTVSVGPNAAAQGRGQCRTGRCRWQPPGGQGTRPAAQVKARFRFRAHGHESTRVPRRGRFRCTHCDRVDRDPRRRQCR